MKPTLRHALATAALLGAAAFAQAQYSVGAITQALTVAEIESALTTAGVVFTGTTRIEGIAFGPGDTVFIVHSDSTENLTIAQFDLGTKAALWTKTEASVVSDLGLSGNLPLVGEVVFDASANRLYLASNIGWSAPNDPYTLFSLSTNVPRTAAVVLRNASIQGWNSHGVMPTGEIVGALGEEHELITGNEPVVGYVDPAAGTPVFVPLFDMDEFVDVAGLAPTEALPPETIGVDPTSGRIYVFGHDNFEFFGIDGLSALEPELLPVEGWTDTATALIDRVDLHGIDVDDNGNVWGFDEAAERIVIWDGNDVTLNATGEVPFDDFTAAIGVGPTPPAFEATVWRGFKARSTGANSYQLVFASATNDYGVVLVSVTGGTSVQNWQVFQ